jgi:hypothetical protein
MPQVLVGRDVAAYTVGGINADGSAAGALNFLGMFKDFSLDAKKEWVEVPASSASEQERRRTLFDWTLTLNNQIRSGSASLMGLMLTYDYIQVLWQDEPNGRILIATGGIESCQMKRDKGEGIQTMSIVDTGTIITNGASSLTYG